MPLDRGHRSVAALEKKPTDQAYIQVLKDETAKRKAELEHVRQSVMECNQLKLELNKQIQDVRLILDQLKDDLAVELENKTNIIDEIECSICAKQVEIKVKNEEIDSLQDDLESTIVSLNEAQDELGNINLTIHKIINEKNRQEFELQALQNNTREFSIHAQAAKDEKLQQLDVINRDIETRLSELSGVLYDISDRSGHCDTMQIKLDEMQIKLKSEEERLLKLKQLNETIEYDKLKNTERAKYLYDWSQRLEVEETALKNKTSDLIKRESKLKEAMRT